MRTDAKELDKGLATIEGHLKGIRKMVSEDTYCVDGFKEGRTDAVITELSDLFDLAPK